MGMDKFFSKKRNTINQYTNGEKQKCEENWWALSLPIHHWYIFEESLKSLNCINQREARLYYVGFIGSATSFGKLFILFFYLLTADITRNI